MPTFCFWKIRISSTAPSKTIKQSWINSEWALKINLDRVRKIFNSIDDEYLRSRKTDLDYIEQRILRNLLGKGTESLSQIKEEVIVVAHDLSPADTAQMAKDKVTAFVTDMGGKTSHTAIMARSLEIPAVVGSETGTHYINTGDTLIVDGITGVVVVNPSPEIIQEYQDRQPDPAEDRAGPLSIPRPSGRNPGRIPGQHSGQYRTGGRDPFGPGAWSGRDRTLPHRISILEPQRPALGRGALPGL